MKDKKKTESRLKNKEIRQLNSMCDSGLATALQKRSAIRIRNSNGTIIWI